MNATRRCFARLLAATGFSLLGSAALAQPTPVTLKLGTILPPQAPFVQQGLQGWITAVTADSGGALKIDLFAGGSLVKHPDQQLKMVLDNVAQISLFPNNTVPGRFPDDAVFELPLGPRNAAEASVAAWKLYEQGRLRGYEGMKVLAFLANGPAILQTTFPIKSTADLKDRKLRASTDAQVDMIRAFGGNPIGGIPITALAEGMSRGLVEGSVTSWSAWAAFRMDRIATHHLELPMGYSILPLVMNEQAWASLPPAAKAAIEKHSYLAGSKRFGEVDAAITDAIRTKGLERDGGRTQKLDAGQEAAVRSSLEGVIAKWRKSHPKGEALHDALLQASKDAASR